MRSRHLVIALVLIVVFVGCPTTPAFPPQVADAAPWGYEDGSTGPNGPKPAHPVCDRACVNLRALGCPEGTPVTGGDSCEDVCARSDLSGHFSIKPQCLADSGSVEQLRACGTVRCQK